MAQSSLLGGEPAPEIPEGRTIARLGPSDSSDSGSDADLPGMNASDSDAAGTGERASVEMPQDEVVADADTLPDRVVSPDGAEKPKLGSRDAHQLAQEQARAIDA